MMAKVILAHSQPEQTVEIYRAQARERDDAPKQTPRRGRGR
jgi:hypothetical protein